MLQDATNDLMDLSKELAALIGKPPASPVPVPEDSELHPDLAAVLATGAIALTSEGIDLESVPRFTEDAKKRGLRRKVLVFGWAPRGDIWYATPERAGDEPTVMVIKRLERLATEELPLEDFLERCKATTQARIENLREAREQEEEDKRKAAEAKAKRKAERATLAPEEPLRKSVRHVKVELADSNGATVRAGKREETFTGEELGYVIWGLTGLELLSDDAAPDLDRWESRILRSLSMDALPAEGTPEREAYQKSWLDRTERVRSATGSVSYQVPAWKLSAPGIWIFAEREVEILRRSAKATPPRHTPSKEQKAIWKRFMGLFATDAVEIVVD